VTSTPRFLIDAASFQGDVNWWTVAIGCAGGWEKATQGTTYVNPYWATAQPAMAAQIPRGFTPGAYVFMEAGDGAAQADWFASHAGNLDGFGLAVDAEPSYGLRRLAHVHPEVHTADPVMAASIILRATSAPTEAQVRACVARLRHHYPGKPIGGYLPEWFWGLRDTTFVDYLWASNYVAGQGRPAALYEHVTPAQWGAYGGRRPALLQFTSSAAVPGVNGVVDCSAYEGSDLAGLMTGAAPSGPGLDNDMGSPAWLPNQRAVPLALDNAVRRIRFLGLGGGESLKLDWMSGASPDQPTGSVTVGYAQGAEGVKVPEATATAPRPDGVRVVRADLPEGVTDYSLVGVIYLY